MVPGDVIGERYRLVAPLAEGGMGVVWRAHHEELDVEVALKVMSGSSFKTESAVRRFRQEARAAAKLRSPHIVQVLDFGVHDGNPYLAMELLRGESLAERLEREGAIRGEAAANILDGIGKALTMAHEAHIVHRDLKPENIFIETVGGEEVVKVLDFGVAKDLKDKAVRTTDGGIVGSPAYMSPEQVEAQPLDARSDIWSLGVVTYEMIFGRNPFLGESLGQVFMRITAGELPKATISGPKLPSSVDSFFNRCIVRERDRRFATARDLANAFRKEVASVAPELFPATPNDVRTADPDAETLLIEESTSAVPAATANTVEAPSLANPDAGRAGTGTLGAGVTSRSARPSSKTTRGAVVVGAFAVAAVAAIWIGFSAGAGPTSDPTVGATTPATPDKPVAESGDAPDVEPATTAASALPTQGGAPASSAEPATSAEPAASAKPTSTSKPATQPLPAIAPPAKPPAATTAKPPAPPPTVDPIFGVPTP